MSRSKYAILGMLTIEPMTGYDMKKVSEEALGHFWHESYGNLYPRLKQLDEQGLVEVRLEERAGGPDAKVYSLTPRGRSEFQEWLARAPDQDWVRSDLLLKVFFGSQAEPGLTARQIRTYRARQRQTQEAFAAMEARLRGERSDNPNQPFWLMTLRRGQLTVQARLQWCDECLEILESGEGQGA